MNERIRELAEQATCDIEDKYGNWVGRNFDKKKFAELIVRECADWIDRQDESRCPYGVDLLEHFEVEQ